VGHEFLMWRLISANGRELGRGTGSYADPDSSWVAIRELAGRLNDGQLRVMGADGRSWRWELLLDDEVVVAGSRTFDRRLRCELAAALFLELMPPASLREPALAMSARAYRPGPATIDLTTVVIDLADGLRPESTDTGRAVSP
jgi:hypothetical protein